MVSRTAVLVCLVLAHGAAALPDVVLSHADKIDVDFLAIFLNSLHQHAPQVQAYLFFMEEPTPEVTELIDAVGAHSVLLRKSRGLADVTPMLARWLVLEQWLLPRRHDFGRILLSDSKDVVFQGNPFQSLEGGVGGDSGVSNHIHLALEGTTIREADINLRWLTTAYGSRVAESLGDRTVICSGTTLGGGVAIVGYVTMMAGEMRRLLREGKDVVGIDQAVLNHLAYTGALERGSHPSKYVDKSSSNNNKEDEEEEEGEEIEGSGKLEVTLLSPKNGTIMTLQEMSHFNLDVFGRVLNGNGDVAPIVHQYNRFPPLEFRLKYAYPYWRKPLRTMRHRRAHKTGLKGLELLQKGDHKGAEKALQEGIVTADVISLLAVAQGRIGKSRKAEVSHRSAIQCGGLGEMAWVNYGGFLLEEERYQEAADAFETVLKNNPQSKQASANLERCRKESPIPLLHVDSNEVHDEL